MPTPRHDAVAGRVAGPASFLPRAPRVSHAALLAVTLAAGTLLAAGCGSTTAAPDADAPPGPCLTTPSTRRPDASGDAIPRFAAGSPFEADYRPPAVRDGKRLWARSCLYAEAPALVVEEWLGPRPETAGKYVLVEFWATWCPPCRKSIHLLNRLHARFADDLVVIGLSDEPAEAVRALRDPRIAYYSAVDTQARMKEALGVFGIPHVILIEPGGYVVWEGFPLQEGYELTEAKVEKILAVGRAGSDAEAEKNPEDR
jgi:thiol-disulfide isomerase/thioredoxin